MTPGRFNKSLHLSDLWEILLSKLGIIVLSGVLVVSAMLIYAKFIQTPEYTSTATLYILKQGSNSQYKDEASEDFSLALNVVNDCTYSLKSHAVLDRVIEDLDLDMSYRELNRTVSTSNPENTRILEVRVTNESPQLSKRIVDRICEVGADKIEDAMGFKQVNLYEYGIIDTRPSNRIRIREYLLAGLFAMAFTFLLFVVLRFFDDSIQSNEDIEKYLGLSILGEIPNASEKTKGYYKSYGRNNAGKIINGGRNLD